jgi:hypothetical protein
MKGAGMFGENIDKIANEHGWVFLDVDHHLYCSFYFLLRWLG